MNTNPRSALPKLVRLAALAAVICSGARGTQAAENRPLVPSLEEAVRMAEVIVIGMDGDFRFPAAGAYMINTDYVLKGPALRLFRMQGALLLAPNTSYILCLRPGTDANGRGRNEPVMEAVPQPLTEATPATIDRVMKLLRAQRQEPVLLNVRYSRGHRHEVSVHFRGDGRFEEFQVQTPPGVEPKAGRKGQVAKEKLAELMGKVARAEDQDVVDEQPDYSLFRWLGDDGKLHRKHYAIPHRELLEAVEQLLEGKADKARR